MKNLKKALAVLVASSVMCASVPAFATLSASGSFSSVNNAVTASYAAIADNTVRATVDASKAIVGKEMTFVILDNDVSNQAVLDGTYVADDVLYIDQATLGSSNYTFEGVINLDRVNGATTTLPNGSYPIRVGYYYDNNGTPTFAIATATMVVSSGTIITVLWGDVDQNGIFNSNDAGKIVTGLTGGSKTCGDYTLGQTTNGILWGDIDQNGIFNSNDAGKIVTGLTGGSKTCGSFTLGQSSQIQAN